MRRFIFAALCVGLAVGEARAQQVPARELLEFPIATVAEGPALARQVTGGLWNPALIATRPGQRLHASAAALNTPIAQGVAAQHVGASFRLRSDLFGSVAFTHAQVSDLLRTDTDPSTEVPGGEIPYNTSVLSAGVAWTRGTVTVGGAMRYRHGEADVERSGAFSTDVGVLVNEVLGTPLRVGASTFLLSPTSGSREPLTVAAAAEYPVLRDSVSEAGLGYSFQKTRLYGHEHYLFAMGRWGRLEGRAGVAENRGIASSTRRLRLGLGLQYARYLVGLAREETGAGLGASYQFTLTAMFK